MKLVQRIPVLGIVWGVVVGATAPDEEMRICAEGMTISTNSLT